MTIPNFAPQNVSCSGIVIFPPADSASNLRAMSAASSKSSETCMLFPAVTGVPGGESLTITTPSPMCRTACMMRSFDLGRGRLAVRARSTA